MSRKGTVVTAVAMIVAVSACSDSSGPSPYPDIDGTWTYTASMSASVGGTTMTCDMTNFRLSIKQSGGTFTGTYSQGSMDCIANGQDYSQSGFMGSVVDGNVTEAGAIRFDFDTADLHQTGTCTETAMSGTANWTIDVGTVVTFSGSWSATR